MRTSEIEKPSGARGFSGHGSEEVKAATLYDLYRGQQLPDVVYTLEQLGALETEWLRRGGRGNQQRQSGYNCY